MDHNITKRNDYSKSAKSLWEHEIRPENREKNF